MTAVLVVVSQISIPTAFGVPITLQIFVVCLSGYLLGLKKSLIVIGVYVALGCVGVPVFANFSGGVFHLVSYTGGFIWGFFPVVLLTSVKQKHLKIPLGILGVLICHFIGATQYSLVGKIPFYAAFFTSSLPFILKDILLVVFAFIIAKMIKKRIKTN